MKVVFNKINIFSTRYVHFGCGIRTIEMELNQLEPQYIKNLGNWKLDTQDECYLANIPIKIIKLMAVASKKQKFQYKLSTVPKTTEELQRIIFPFVDRFIN